MTRVPPADFGDDSLFGKQIHFRHQVHGTLVPHLSFLAESPFQKKPGLFYSQDGSAFKGLHFFASFLSASLEVAKIRKFPFHGQAMESLGPKRSTVKDLTPARPFVNKNLKNGHLCDNFQKI